MKIKPIVLLIADEMSLGLIPNEYASFYVSSYSEDDEEEAGLKIVELENDPELEKNINDCADRNNLGIRNIKQILKYVIRKFER